MTQRHSGTAGTIAAIIDRIKASSRADRLEGFILATLAADYSCIRDWVDDLRGSGICGDTAFIATAMARHIREIQQVPGFEAGGGCIVYPLPSYGWDGGDAIGTTTFNLELGPHCDAFKGPFATLCRQRDPGCPGLALHNHEGKWLLQVFEDARGSFETQDRDDEFLPPAGQGGETHG